MLLPSLAILLLVSSQTGINVHSRYVLPLLPFAFVWISKIARSFALRHRALASAVTLSLAWSVTSSLWVYPHSLSHFNELVGGPKCGHYCLLDSNIGWGQDLLYLKRWLDEHPEVYPLRFASFGYVDPRLVGIEFTLPPVGPRSLGSETAVSAKHLGPHPGYYAVDVNHLRRSHSGIADGNGNWRYVTSDDFNYCYFLRYEPVAMAGYSIYIYHITLDEANRVRRELGLPELPSPQQPTGGTDDEDVR